MVSGNNTLDKFAKSGLTYTKSTKIDAPIINEFPISIECELLEITNDSYGTGVIAKVVNTSALVNVMKDDEVDITSLNALAFDPYTHGYYKVTERVGSTFKEGFEIKNK